MYALVVYYLLRPSIVQVNVEPMDPTIAKLYPFRYWSIAEKKGYCKVNVLRPSFTYSQDIAGTAIFSKHKPISVDKTLPGHPNPTIWKGRIITLEYPNFYLVGTYAVNAGDNLKVHSVILGKILTLKTLQDPRRKGRME